MSPESISLEFSPADMHALMDEVMARIVPHVASLPDQPARGDVHAEDLCRAMREPIPQEPAALAPLLDRFFSEWVPRSFTAPGPGYLAFIPGGGLYSAALADVITNTVNRYTGVWVAAPALVQLEANALDWLRDWMGFPSSTRGLFTTGGSMSNFSGILCAREKHLGVELRRGTMYVSSQAHQCVVKSARLAGIMPDRVRTIPVDDAFRMRTDALAERVAADRRDGFTPFLVVSSAGTTNTGAVDPLDEVADLCARERLWHHVDGAYGAFFHACEDLRHLLSGLSRADSLTLDPHKGLFLPYGTGALLVRDGAMLRRAHSLGERASYLPPDTDPGEFYDPTEHGPDLSRGFPGLRVWLTVKMFGASKLQAAIREKRTLAVDAAERIAAIPGIVMDAPPQLSLFAFHLTWPGATVAGEDAATRELLERVTARGRVFLTGCTTNGRFYGRVCVLSFRTHADRIDDCVGAIREEAAAIVAART